MLIYKVSNLWLHKKIIFKVPIIQSQSYFTFSTACATLNSMQKWYKVETCINDAPWQTMVIDDLISLVTWLLEIGFWWHRQEKMKNGVISLFDGIFFWNIEVVCFTHNFWPVNFEWVCNEPSTHPLEMLLGIMEIW